MSLVASLSWRLSPKVGSWVACFWEGLERLRNGIQIKTIFESEALSERERRAILSGKSTKGIPDPGPLVCACFGVGLNVIRAALASGRAASVEQIGVALRAATIWARVCRSSRHVSVMNASRKPLEDKPPRLS